MVVVERHPEAQPSAGSSPALAIEGVSHHYGPRQALVDVSLSIPPATFVVLLGLNAAGKSMLFSLVTRLFATQRGQIRIFGHDIARAHILSHVRSLVADEGVSVLWATHLVDEVSEADTVAVLNRGRILAHGPVPGVVAGAHAKDIGSAFAWLIESKAIGPRDKPA